MNYFWKEMPFVRFIIPLIAGIIFQYYTDLPFISLIIFLSIIIAGIICFNFLQISLQYTFRWIQGLLVHLLLFIGGALLVYQKDIRHDRLWIGKIQSDTIHVIATLQEPLVEKAKSYKAEAEIEQVFVNGGWKKVNGKLLVYFGKESSDIPSLHYGTQILFNKPLQGIKNSGNPGNFNYIQFNAFKDIYHQVFLKSHDFVLLKGDKINSFQQWLYEVRSFVIKRLQQFIPGDKESGVAEALLIGYRDDLDKDLVQDYSNTGVVHIIAISGLHLGMIYGVLIFLFGLFKNRKFFKWLKPVVILGVLWIFTFLAGAAPSILRSAVMFSFIIMGETINRKSSVYNTLASSAFVMLCINPFFLWDIGFQLSYIAVVSIVVFSKPVYNWLYVENKMLDFIWKLTSVTIAAQILTVPVIFYSFHQFPNLFLITNCVVVPLSTIGLFAELVVLIVSPFGVVAEYSGKITGWLLHLMNSFIEIMSSYKFAVTDNIQVSLTETILLYGAIIFVAIWLMKKSKISFYIGFCSLVILVLLLSADTYLSAIQKRIIVYNVPKQTSIDFIEGNKYSFLGDSIMTTEGYLKNFHLKPARTLYKATVPMQLKSLLVSRPFIYFNDKRILVIDKPYIFESENKIKIDAIVLTKSPRVSITDLKKTFDCNNYIVDGANSTSKINIWKKESRMLNLPLHICTETGAFELKL